VRNFFIFYFFAIVFDVDDKKRNKEESLGKPLLQSPLLYGIGCAAVTDSVLRLLL
jgi:hypothetical protein